MKDGSHAEHVYFLQFGKNTPIKIGYTSNLGARLQTIASSHWVEPSILLAMPGNRSTEAVLHLRLKAHRIRSTEWFRYEGQVVKVVDDVRHNDIPAELVESIRLAGWRTPEELYKHTKGGLCPTCKRPTYREFEYAEKNYNVRIDDEGYVSVSLTGGLSDGGTFIY